MDLPKLLRRRRQSRSCNSLPRWENTRGHGLNGGAGASDALREDIYAMRRALSHVDYSPYLEGPSLLRSHMMSSPFRALVRILLS